MPCDLEQPLKCVCCQLVLLLQLKRLADVQVSLHLPLFFTAVLRHVTHLLECSNGPCQIRCIHAKEAEMLVGCHGYQVVGHEQGHPYQLSKDQENFGALIVKVALLSHEDEG